MCRPPLPFDLNLLPLPDDDLHDTMRGCVISSLIAYSLWLIWTARNDVVFQNVCISPLSIAYKAVSYLYDSSIVNRPAGMQPLQLGISSIQVCWSCPAAEWIKLNMDGLLRPFHSLEVQVLCLEIARLAVFLLAVRVLNKEDPLPWFFYSLREIFALLDLIVEWRVTHKGSFLYPVLSTAVRWKKVLVGV
ncbi:hypothetical protein C4D60_Mb01t21120 [Musa balbisiana]|uniref:Uncharacterized protein n=1 Tax=Musa balbisiana TaxID=52838 RepID=A0A4S8JNW0_MUSBA|nr:hypothetical protein C4D60_Mb01t21120 [Musa balbisiana]